MAIASVQRYEAVHSTWLETERGVSVYFPAGYDPTRADRYPLLILHDGQNLFDDERAHAGVSWRVAETADRLIDGRSIEPLVIVGVDHGQTARAVEFTPTTQAARGQRIGDLEGLYGGGAERYARFIMDELLPYLQNEHGLSSADVGMGGSSLGALVTLVIAAAYPGVFRRLMLMSPSVWWDKRVILKILSQAQDFGPTRVWLDVGRKEGANTVRDARRLRDTLRPMLSSPGALRYVEDPAGNHSERSWGRRFGDALQFLYGR